MLAYFNSRFIPEEEIRISPDDRGFVFGDGAYEVIRSYGGRLFEAEKHLLRLERSLRELRITDVDVASFLNIATTLLERNNLRTGDATVYIQVTRGVAPRRHSFPAKGTPPTVYLAASALQPPSQKIETGVTTVLVPDIRWSRCDIKSVSLVANVLANQQAKESGAEEAIFVRDGAITEGTHSNVCAVYGGELVTHPTNHHILAGITREVVLSLCRGLGIAVSERPILAEELLRADELILLGTTTEVMPIIRVNDRQVREGVPGPITRRLQNAFHELTRNERAS